MYSLNKIVKTRIANEELILDPLKAVFWPLKSWLLIADFHIGKASHFRSNGIAAPTFLNSLNLKNLNRLLKVYQPRQVIFLGDLFHSRYNQDWESFTRLLKAYPGTGFRLVTGNHDILGQEIYDQAGLECVPYLDEPPFYLTHHPTEEAEHYNLAGHIHPGIVLYGKARQSMRMPCFVFGEKKGLLPAFGNFTGLGMVKPMKQDRIFCVAGQEVVEVGLDQDREQARKL